MRFKASNFERQDSIGGEIRIISFQANIISF